MLFGVPDEITDVTRVSEMVRKRRLIYRMTSFDYRKVFGVTGNVPGMTNGFREFTGGEPTPGKPIGLGGDTPDLSGLVGQPTSALCAMEKKIKRERKKKGGGGKEGGLPPTKPSPTRFGGESPPPWLGRPLGDPLDPKAGSPSLLLYIWGF